MRTSHAPGRFGNIAGGLLVGGESTRMGRDKAHIELGGVPMATRLAKLLSSMFEEVVLVGGNPPEDAPGRRVSDPEVTGGAANATRSSLRGLTGALEAVNAERVLVIATDSPLLTADLLLALTAYPAHDAVVVEDASGWVHPLCAIYKREAVLPKARERLAAGDFKLRGLLDAVDTQAFGGADLAAIDPDGTVLTNINTPEDLQRVRALLAQ